MKELVLVPEQGLCNRLRAIASARRVCGALDAPLTIVWEWGAWEDVFEPIPDAKIVSKKPVEADSFDRVQTRSSGNGGPVYNQNLVFPAGKEVLISTCQLFSSREMPPVSQRELCSHYPTPRQELRDEVRRFRASLSSSVTGFHVRRTDNAIAAAKSGDGLFEEEFRQVIAAGGHAFLSTDNVETREKFRSLFGGSLSTRPHQSERPQRWPRPSTNSLQVQDDLLDLLALAACDWIVGSSYSSYSETAIALNGDSRCKILTASEG